jgi:hypothetical protein
MISRWPSLPARGTLSGFGPPACLRATSPVRTRS